MEPPQEHLEWEAFEYERVTHSTDWYIAVGIIAGSIAVGAIITHNILFAGVIVLGTFALLLYARRPPRLVSYKVEERGIRIGQTFHSYEDGESFCVWEDRTPPRLIVKRKDRLMPLLVIPIAEVAPSLVRERLLTVLPEEELHESFSERLMEALGF